MGTTPGSDVAVVLRDGKLPARSIPWWNWQACEFAPLSAKYDPDFLPALGAARYPQLVNLPSILAPLPTNPQPTNPHERENEKDQQQDSF